MNKRKGNLDENKSKEKQRYNINCIGNNNRTKLLVPRNGINE